jgi:serine-type D-Ala-D-Ala carboxypeptidase/endopeptidase (penicillin-binding protein 4)
MPYDRRFPLLLTALLALAGCNPSEPNQGASPAPATKPSTAPAQQGPLAVAPGTPDPQTTATIEQSLKKLSSQGYPTQAQGIWIQAGNTLLANHQGTTPLSAASLTKVATSLAALQTFGVDHRFETVFATTSTIENGVVKGDLIIQGNDNPFFVWEEAIAVGNALNQLGIKKVTGNLIIVGRFFMNYDFDPVKSGTLLKQALDSSTWAGEVVTQFKTLPTGTPKPQLAIVGNVVSAASVPANVKPVLRHKSLPLPELLKKMNRYSNNPMAEIIANASGGAKQVSFKAAQAAGVPQNEIILINGSGLAVENRISPRAVCSMFLALEQYLKPMNMTISDLFAVAGQDTGILEGRKLPNLAVTKSGSLDAVSALAGAVPTSKKGTVWFVVMNGGGSNLEGFRAEQENLLRSLVNQWGTTTAIPTELTINPERTKLTSMIEKI